jgi:hypothetical protein
MARCRPMIDHDALAPRTADRASAFAARGHCRLAPNYFRLRPAYLQADRPLLGRRRLDDLRQEDKESAMKFLRQVTIVFGPQGTHPSALDRVVSVMRSRYCDVTSLEYHAPGVKRPGAAVAVATLSGDETRLALLVHKLAGLVEVLDVSVVVVEADELTLCAE